ncbi:uncharacterized protein si:dkey-175g6.2 [Hippocampus zosterae]|uniref:uncharacterized protein si:dkey-175g6.2 n=1 Tax=Hippocampus zosterae TaxID=109293 RepID=UPI00223D49E1|nr:uncharacterized protein si:dkey-175g6.2 [Hippocampus zosterae]
MVMTRHHASPSARLILLVLLPVTLRLATEAAPAWAKPEDRGTAKGGEEAAAAAAEEEETVLVPPPRGDDNNTSQDGDERLELGSDPARARALLVLLQALDWPPEASANPQGASSNLLEVNEISRQPEADKAIQDFEDQRGRGGSAEDLPEKASDESFLAAAAAPQGDDDGSLRRKIRGYFQNIDLGLQDNEILPPLKGYKAYNTQLARAGKKLHWQGPSQAGPVKGGNFMDDFEEEDEGGEPEEEVEEEDESLSRMEEEARARAEKQEVLRQQEEAERAREEEQRLADVASDMLLQYMGRKQQAFLKPRQKSSNAAEDKRSEEVLLPDRDEDDLDQQMIDRLIEISSKLHLPADDVIEIISDVEEKKKKRKELQEQQQRRRLPPPPAAAALPVLPRFRPLVPPPLAAAPPVYHYTASKNPKKALYKVPPYKASYKSMKKWPKDKGKSRKKDFWYQPQTPIDYWYKPQKQFLAFPSYPYYQKPYRAYYPVYFPYPKPQYYGKPPPARDRAFNGQDLDPQSPRRRHRGQGKNRGQGWRQRPAPRLPDAPYISNYILPHPRTYQPPPPPKPLAPPRGARRPPFYYQPAAARDDDYEEDGLLPQLDSEEELENFIERIYMKRRMY